MSPARDGLVTPYSNAPLVERLLVNTTPASNSMLIRGSARLMAKLTVFGPTILATPTFRIVQPQRQDFQTGIVPLSPQPTHPLNLSILREKRLYGDMMSSTSNKFSV
jgi:hypothetical protein